MKLIIRNNKLYKKTLFSTTEIDARDINRVEIERENTDRTVYLKSGESITAKNLPTRLYEDEISYYLSHNITFEDKSYRGIFYIDSEIKEKMEQTRKKAQSIASKIIKENLGKSYDVDASIVGECWLSILVFKLVENGIVLEKHPLYDEMGELGVDKAIDYMHVSFLVKWDSSASERLYGVTVEVEDEKALEDYITIEINEQIKQMQHEMKTKSR